MFLVRSVCLFVCLSVGLLANLWTDFDKIFYRSGAWLKDQVIQFWWRSGSRFGSGSPKSEIRILRIAVFGGGLFSLSASSLPLFSPHGQPVIIFSHKISWRKLWVSSLIGYSVQMRYKNCSFWCCMLLAEVDSCSEQNIDQISLVLGVFLFTNISELLLDSTLNMWPLYI